MSARITKFGKETLVSSLSTCGGKSGPMFGVAQKVAASNEGEDLSSVLRLKEFSIPLASMVKLEKICENSYQGVLTPEAVVERYALSEHFHDMSSQPSIVAAEMTAEVKDIAHLLLPLTNGMYVNEGVFLPIKNYVPLGNQEGNLVVHLGGCFSSRCHPGFIRRILQEQSKIPGFLELANKLSAQGGIDYDNYPKLISEIKRAKEILGL